MATNNRKNEVAFSVPLNPLCLDTILVTFSIYTCHYPSTWLCPTSIL